MKVFTFSFLICLVLKVIVFIQFLQDYLLFSDYTLLSLFCLTVPCLQEACFILQFMQ